MSAMASQITTVSSVCSTVWSKKTSKFRANGLCEGNPTVTDGFPSQRASNAKMFPLDDVIIGLGAKPLPASKPGMTFINHAPKNRLQKIMTKLTNFHWLRYT